MEKNIAINSKLMTIFFMILNHILSFVNPKIYNMNQKLKNKMTYN